MHHPGKQHHGALTAAHKHETSYDGSLETTLFSPGDGLVKFVRAFCGKAIGVLRSFTGCLEDWKTTNTQIAVFGNNGHVQTLKSESKIQRSETNNENCGLVRDNLNRELPAGTPGTNFLNSEISENTFAGLS